MATVYQLLESLAPDAGKRGRQFEHICKWYLTHAPEYKSLLSHVWLWKDWPGRWGVDCGIDLVAETKQGQLWAIQAKAYSPEYSIRKSDIDSFLSESARGDFVFRLLIATTDIIGKNAQRTLESQAIPTSRRLLSDLSGSGLEWPANPASLHANKPRRAEPYPFQQQAIKNIVAGFTTIDQGQLRMACGTGKTLVSLWVAEHIQSQRTLVLLPSLSLMAGTIRTWVVNSKNAFAYLPVCSDETVDDDDDALTTKAAELGFPAVTDPISIADFMRRNERIVVFSTYHSSPLIAKAFEDAGVPPFDLAIADEAHRCAGPVPRAFSTILEKKRIKADRRLFMTATPRFYKPELRKKAEGCDLQIASMDDEKHFGPSFHALSFSKAIELELLSDYQVAIVVIDNPTYKKYADRGKFVSTDGTSIVDARTLASHIAVAKAMREYDLRKFISFHSRVKGAAEFSKRLPEVIAWMPECDRPDDKLICQSVSGAMPAGQREAILSGIRNSPPDTRFLISNARCLGEGIDVPSLDGVVFIDPRRSQVEIIQALGRAIRKSPNKKIGTVVLPVFIDTSADAKKAVESSAFKPVWDVLLALRAHDDVLGETLDRLRQDLGQFRNKQLNIPGKIHIELPVSVDQRFSEAMRLKLVESTTASWDYAYGLFKRYIKDNGHPFVPARHRTEENYRLGAWLAEQRGSYRQNNLLPERQKSLESIPGWKWEPLEVRWQNGFRSLAEYVKQNGNARVGQDYVCSDGYFLGRWAAGQRQRYRDGILSETKQKAFEQMPGWSWDLSRTWETGFKKLIEYSKTHYAALIPWSYKTEDGYALGHWVTCKRQELRKGKLDVEIRRAIEGLPGWKWNRKEARLAIGRICLAEYSQREGHTFVPISHMENGFPLGQWVSLLRRKYQENRLSPTLQQLAESVAHWSWARDKNRDIDADWAKGMHCLEEFAAINGHACVPKEFISVDGFSLGKWAHQLRAIRRAGKLDEERIRILSDFPCWIWGQKEMAWFNRYSALIIYANEHNLKELSPSYRTNGGYDLWKWAKTQCLAHRRGTLAPNYVNLLNNIPGWKWDVSVHRSAAPTRMEWGKGFSELATYTQLHGTADVKMSLVNTSGYALGRWACLHRRLYMAGHLTPEQKEALEKLPGWTWDRNESNWDHSYDSLRRAISSVGEKALALSFVTPDGEKIGIWAQIQRRAYRKGILSDRRVKMLEILPGWYWVPMATPYEKCDANWLRRIEELKRFANKHNHARFSKAMRSIDGTNLGHWVITQRKAFHKGTLSTLQIQSLESIPGWTWNPYEDNWKHAYSKLVDYYATHGQSTITPKTTTKDGFKIGSWIATQRNAYKKGKLPVDRCRSLEAIPGWQWGSCEWDWHDAFKCLQDTILLKKLSDISPSYSAGAGINLGLWIRAQRHTYKNGLMPDDRKRLLEDIPGWTWSQAPASSWRWEEFISNLKTFKARTGHANVPVHHSKQNGNALGYMVAKARRDYKRGLLAKEQIVELEGIDGWAWQSPVLNTYIRTDALWDEIFNLLCEYTHKQGHSLVPTKYITSDGKRLGYWIIGQRRDYHKGKLSAERISKLESLPGWAWAPGEKNWPRDYKRALKALEGLSMRSIRQTHILPDGFRLGRWINHQRMDRRLGTLSEEQIRLLERIPGWTWNTLDTKWDEAYAMLLDYTKQTGCIHVPLQYKVPANGFTLGQWVRIQMRHYRQGKLDQRRIMALSKLPEWKWV